MLCSVRGGRCQGHGGCGDVLHGLEKRVCLWECAQEFIGEDFGQEENDGRLSETEQREADFFLLQGLQDGGALSRSLRQ